MMLDPSTTPSYISNLTSQANTNTTTTTTTTTSSTRKRPVKTPAEKEWQEKNWTNPASLRATTPTLTAAQTSLATTQRDYEALKLAYELQKFEEGRAQAPRANLKYQPKPAPRRYRERMASPPSMDVDPPTLPSPPDALSHTPAIPAASDNDSDYVIDLYVRKTNPHPSTTSLADIAPAHGFLVIEEDQQIIWEACGEEDEDAEEYDSEDSNAEDSPWNDYPDREDFLRLWGHRSEEFEDEEDDDEGFGEDGDEGDEEGFRDHEGEGGAVGRMGRLRMV